MHADDRDGLLCYVCDEEVRNTDARCFDKAGTRHDWCDPDSATDKAARVIAHVKGRRPWKLPDASVMRAAEVILGDRGNNKYEILKCRLPLSYHGKRVLPSTAQMLAFLREQARHNRNLKLVWVIR